ncbi:hypothetical protein PQC07_gp174 [Aeromonas phage D3]|uniref:Uncharacterized protein n=3 Tax=Ludhianavirus TaxID=3044751 RepID=A0A514A1J9_9CAUD|nr:hypothetical protein PQC06_gp032 [Aeromonas phage LAh10]YP_010668582.1 hypothetical protein PQC07_gp174 [Aeromonas phage D3]YP_010668848.1 hypothetical protein PQC08_gp175 [Aeromonas phage D6]QDH47153.1 hypothetical protein LAh10_32 [Aeromonas phage LAh10]QDJ97099.1 hypothetical protein D3_0101 [Aeromonas phage D3]QDJ97260.1 hypothetical protein D6_0100 [Aeromonas phage D6]
MIIKLGDSEQKIVFLREQDLKLLKMFNLQPTDLPTLPAIREVSDEDCLSWLEFQRAAEKTLFGFSSTTYTNAGNIKNLMGERTNSALFKAKMDKVLEATPGKVKYNHLYGYNLNGMMFVLLTSNTVESTWFRELPGSLANAVMRVCLDTVGSFGFYFKSERNLSQTTEQKGYVTAGTILSKVLA